MSDEKLDLIIFGATGFTGRLAAQYVAQHFPKDLRWAISGRSREKLGQVYQTLAHHPNPPQGSFVLDHSDQKKVFDVVGKTKVAASFAGPFGRYGENIVAACAELGTDYLDITGEPLWVQKMIERYEDRARKSGAVLIPFSGFDSIPSDLGVWLALEKSKEKPPHPPITRVLSVFSAKGGLNGGTFQTLLDMLANRNDGADLHGKPSILVPDELKEQFRFSDSKWPVLIKEKNQVMAPFLMGPINSRVVYRSQALRISRLSDPQPPFEYSEFMSGPKALPGVSAWGTVLGLEAVSWIGKSNIGRRLLRGLGPNPGQGPTTEVQESGFFKVRVYAYSDQDLISQAEISFQGDPGNRATVTMACETARCLLLDRGQLPQLTGGFWTPSTALGTVLKERLIHAGMRF